MAGHQQQSGHAAGQLALAAAHREQQALVPERVGAAAAGATDHLGQLVLLVARRQPDGGAAAPAVQLERRRRHAGHGADVAQAAGVNSAASRAIRALHPEQRHLHPDRGQGGGH